MEICVSDEVYYIFLKVLLLYIVFLVRLLIMLSKMLKMTSRRDVHYLYSRVMTSKSIVTPYEVISG